MILILLTMLLVACAPQDPVYVIITPTPISDTVSPDSTADLAADFTEEASASDTSDDVPLTTSPTVQPSVSPVSPEVMPSQTLSVNPTATIVPGEFFGAIIGPGYTLPPTSTPNPTAVPGVETALPTPESQPPTPTPILTGSQLDGNRIGIQIYANLDIDTYYTMMLQAQKLNVGWVKIQANWAFLQPQNAEQYDQNFRLFESHVQRAKNMGFNVLLSVAKAPDWTRSNVTESDAPPDDPQQLASFLRFMISRIKAENIDAIEVWNEPNLLREWQGVLPFSGAGYMQLFRPAYDAIQEVGPNIRVISAGLAPTGNSAGSIDDRRYLQEMYDAGLGDYPDIAIGIHPYGWGNAPDANCCDAVPDRGWDDDPHFFFKDNVDAYTQIISNAGHDAPMWITELGWATWEAFPSAPPEVWMTYNSAQQQAEYLVRALEINQQRSDIGLTVIWNLNFGSEQAITNQEELAGYSLIYFLPDIGLQFRPAFDALASVIRRE